MLVGEAQKLLRLTLSVLLCCHVRCLQKGRCFVAENFLLNIFPGGVACLSLHPPDPTGEYRRMVVQSQNGTFLSRARV